MSDNMNRTQSLMLGKKGRISLSIGLTTREIENGSDEDNFSEDPSTKEETFHQRPRWFRRVLLAGVFVTAIGIVVL